MERLLSVGVDMADPDAKIGGGSLNCTARVPAQQAELRC